MEELNKNIQILKGHILIGIIRMKLQFPSKVI